MLDGWSINHQLGRIISLEYIRIHMRAFEVCVVFLSQ